MSSFSSVRGGSTLLIFLEPLSSRGKRDHWVISHEFWVVQTFRTCSNQSTTQGSTPVVVGTRVVTSGPQWFEELH